MKECELSLAQERDELRKALEASKAEAAAAAASLIGSSVSASTASESAAALARERDELRKALEAAKAEAAAAIAVSSSAKASHDSLVHEKDALRQAFDAEARRRAEAETKLASAVISKVPVAIPEISDSELHQIDGGSWQREIAIMQQLSPSRSHIAEQSFHTPDEATFRDKVSNARDQLQKALDDARIRASQAKSTLSATTALLHALQKAQPQFAIDKQLESDANQVIRNANAAELHALAQIEQFSQQLESVDAIDSTAELASRIRSISQSSILPQLNSTSSPSKSRPVSSLSMATKITNQYYSLSAAFSSAESVLKSPLLQAFAKERDVLKKALEIEVQARHSIQEQALAASRATQLAESRICSIRAKAAAKQGLLQQALTASDRKMQALQRELEMLQQSSVNHGVGAFLIASETASSSTSPRITLPSDSPSKVQRVDFKTVDLYKAIEKFSDSPLRTLKECGLKLYMSRKDLLLLSNYNQPLFQSLTRCRALSPTIQHTGSIVSTPGNASSAGSRPKTQSLQD